VRRAEVADEADDEHFNVPDRGVIDQESILEEANEQQNTQRRFVFDDDSSGEEVTERLR
jgi:hypothetical protein